MSRSMRVPAVVLAGLLVVSLGGLGCKNMMGGDKEDDQYTKNVDPNSLYARLGGHKAIVAVVDDFVPLAASDPAVNFVRQGHPNNKWQPTPENVAKLKASLTRFIVQATGGPQEYTGPSMADVHKGMEISDEEFGAIAADLKASLDKFNVPQKEQTELLNAVGGLKDQIVGK